ncbi:MAG: AAA family ATPase [Piscinibacter sp.]|uniref:AAA family ATPase n=1 Tax=Piscinibacter sp. TaxID=1903157 RepID=UPI003D0A187B
MLADLERARDALHACDPDCPRDEWVKLAMAAKAAGVDAETFHQWSAQASSYNERDARSVWDSIKRAEGIGPGTLFKTAVQNGWSPTRRGRSARARTERPATRTPEPPARAQSNQTAADLWERCKPAPESHPYIATKRGNAAGLRVVPASDPLRIAGAPMAGALVVPVQTFDGALTSLQFIQPPGSGKKLNLPGASMAGVFVVGDLSTGATAYLCEGIGQAWACWKATGSPSVVCFGWGRVRAVAAEMRQRDSSARLVVVPDVGKERDAEAIARDVGGRFVAMPTGWKANDDVNDYATREGFDALEVLLDGAKEPEADGVVLLSGADLTPQPVSWLWRDWLALGKLHILAGAPGQGKTTLALAMAATVTVGGLWPDGSRCDRGNVLVWSGEDNPADTLLPRLIAAGADKRRVHFISGTRTNGELQPFDPATDMTQLTAQASRIGDVRLIVVDPVVSAVTGDSHKNTEVRRALQPLVDLAASIGAALVGISHFSKGGQGQDPASRVVGSVAFTAVARVVLVAAKVHGENGEDRRILARGKSNIGPDDGGFEYSIAQVETLPGIQASRIEWGAAVQGTARELLRDPEDETEETNAQDAAAAFLREVLGDDLVPVKTVEAEGKAAGLAWRTIRRASESLNVVKRRGAENRWYWSIPKLSKPGNLSNLSNVSGLDNLDNLTQPSTPATATQHVERASR